MFQMLTGIGDRVVFGLLARNLAVVGSVGGIDAVVISDIAGRPGPAVGSASSIIWHFASSHFASIGYSARITVTTDSTPFMSVLSCLLVESRGIASATWCSIPAWCLI